MKFRVAGKIVAATIKYLKLVAEACRLDILMRVTNKNSWRIQIKEWLQAGIIYRMSEIL